MPNKLWQKLEMEDLQRKHMQDKNGYRHYFPPHILHTHFTAFFWTNEIAYEAFLRVVSYRETQQFVSKVEWYMCV